jgi:signal transduction histidine kinase
MEPGPRRLRLRLTLLFCLVSVVSGGLLLIITFTLATTLRGDTSVPPGMILVPPQPGARIANGVEDHSGRAAGVLVVPGLALAIMAVLSLVVGWHVAGRILRPVQTMTARLQQISERNVHERLSVTGPRDELKDLADTVDGLLGRLETALDAHKRFVANAAHELRTPLTVEHALLEEPLIDPDPGVDQFRQNFERLLAISRQRGQLLESLLTLSSSEHGQDRDEPVDLAEVVEAALRDRAPELDRHDLRVVVIIEPARVVGDPVLIGRLVANLCDNAIHYNVPGGTVHVGTRGRGGRVVFSIANTGPLVPPEQVERLFEPFQRLHRTTDNAHHGLGLSIVRAIATAHAADITARPRSDGGLAIEVAFPPHLGRHPPAGPIGAEKG